MLPTFPPNEAPRKAWLKLPQFRDFVGEPVPTKKYKALLKILQRINQIDPAIIPDSVSATMKDYIRPGNPYGNKPAPPTVDEMGRARGRGKRKTSSAVVHLVEGEGEVLVNGKSLLEAFGRLHDRESALWALRCTGRLDKYNVWVTVKGGGKTGQAEAITLALARALLVHEPALKPALRKGMLFSFILMKTTLANLFHSWHNHRRCSSCGKKEARSCQGSQEAHLGQAVKANLCFHFPFFPCCTIILFCHGGFRRSISCIQKASHGSSGVCMSYDNSNVTGVGILKWIKEYMFI